MRKLSGFLVPLFMLLLVFGVGTVAAQDIVQTWGFETALEDWGVGSEGSAIALSAEQALTGTQSVKLVKPAGGLEINFQNDVYDDVKEGDVLTFHIYISAADLALVNGGQIYWQTSAGWAWNSQWVNGSAFTADAWATVEHTMPAIELPLQRIGFQLLLNAGNEAATPALYVDDITITRVLPLIVIDGEKDAFFETLTGPDDGYLQLRNFTGNDNGYADSDMDLSAKVWTAWDEDYFYIYEEVKDDMISMSSNNSYQNDGIELKFDPQPTDSVKNSVLGLQMTALSAEGGITGAAEFPAGSTSFRKLTDDGYVLEAAIPWTAIKSGTEVVDVAVDSIFGLVIQNHDNDNTRGARDASVQWAAVLKDAAWNTPKFAATAKFLADNKLQLIPSNAMTGVTNTLPYDGTVPEEIVVDGKKDPFYYTLEGPEDGYIQLRPYAFTGIGIPYNDADLSAKIWGSWDDTWLYLYAEIKDDTVSCPNTSNFWRNDCLELKIDGLQNGSTVGGPPTVGGLSATNTITALDTPAATGAVSHLESLLEADKKIVRGLMTGGYVLELAMRLDTLGGPEMINAMIDSTFGLGINIVDNDGELPSSNRQAAIAWGAVCSDNIWNTPNFLGTVRFKADNKIAFESTNGMTGDTNKVPYDGRFFINVDGIKDPFYNELTGPADGHLQIRSYAFNDNGAPTDDADLSAKTWAAWDENRFYFYEEVMDDIISASNAANQSYNNDGLEIKIDPQPKTAANSIFSIDMTALYDSTNAGTTNLGTIPDSLKEVARATMTGGYKLELSVDWSVLTAANETISVAVDSVFGAAVNIHDNDAETAGARTASVQWAAVLTDAVWNTPANLATIKFLPDHKLSFLPVNNINGTENLIPYDGSDLTGIDEKGSNIPDQFVLKQNYPNPFNPSTTIAYTIPSSADVRLVIYDILGREVTTLVNEKQIAGTYQVKFDIDQSASGVYLCKLVVDNKVRTLKMMTLK